MEGSVRSVCIILIERCLSPQRITRVLVPIHDPFWELRVSGGDRACLKFVETEAASYGLTKTGKIMPTRSGFPEGPFALHSFQSFDT